MRRYENRIELDKELSFSHSKTIAAFINKKGLRISDDGKGIQWDGTDYPDLEFSLAALAPILKQCGVRCLGVMSVFVDNKLDYEIVAFRGEIKVFKNGQIYHVDPYKSGK